MPIFAIGMSLIVAGIFSLDPSPVSPRKAKADPKAETKADPVPPPATFNERWWPGEGLPPVQRSPYSDYPLVKVVKTLRVTPAPPEPPVEVLPEPVAPPPARSAAVQPVEDPPPEVKPRKVKPRPTRVADICTRHGMRKVDYGRTWRCRR